jgi:putative ABC transport system permease protein
MAQSDLIASDVRHLIRQIDPEVPILQMRTMDQVLTESVSGRQFQTSLAYIVSGFALFLAALGIYSVIAYSVEQRRYEIGIRVALGASPSQLRRLIIRQGMIPIFCGLACGTLVAYGVARTLSSLFFEVKLGNPLIICSSVFIMILIAIVATYIPAARAANINPSIALRSQ